MSESTYDVVDRFSSVEANVRVSFVKGGKDRFENRCEIRWKNIWSDRESAKGDMVLSTTSCVLNGESALTRK